MNTGISGPAPFKVQSPTSIAEAYGGNKAKIVAAVQAGIVDPTAGLMAAMFIDKMRGAQDMENANPPTVAQQVFAPSAPQGAPAGLGATPEAAQMGPMTPPQGGAPMPPQSPEDMQPMGPGMADGGIASLPVPDDMFNSSVGDNQQYADGGIIAFAGAGPVRAPRMSDEDYINYIIQRESGGRGDFNPQGGPLTSPAGAMYAMQVMPATARSPGYGVTPASAQTPAEYNRVGRDYAMALRDRYGDVGGLAAYNMGPGGYEAVKAGRRTMPAETRRYISGVGGAPAPARGAPAPAARASAPPAAPAETLASSFRQLSDLMGVRLTKAQDAKLAAQTGTLEDEKKSKDRDLGYALLEASRAFGKAGPFGSQLGEALANMAGPLREGQKTREAKKLGALTAAAEAERQDYADRAAMLAPAANLYQAAVANRLADRRQTADEDQFDRRLESEVEQGRLNRVSAEALARIQANPSDQEGAIDIIQAEFPNKSRAFALATYLQLLKQSRAPTYNNPFNSTPVGAPAGSQVKNLGNID